MEKQINEQAKAYETSSLPTQKRTKTDVFCTCFGIGYFILLCIIFVAIYNGENLDKITYPNDIAGNLCGLDYPQHPYLYFTSPNNITKRLCVSECPSATDKVLKCKATDTLSCGQNSNPKYEVVIYDSQLDNNRIGLFCFPKDPALKNKIVTDANLSSKYIFLTFYDWLGFSIMISIVFGLISFYVARFFPYHTVPWTILIGSIASFIFGLLVLLFSDGYIIVRLLIFIIFTLLGIASFSFLWRDRRRYIHVSSIVDEDKTKTDKISWSSLSGWGHSLDSLLLITVFMLMFVGFLFIISRFILSAWSRGKLVYRGDYPYYEVVGAGSNILMILIGFQFLWGMFFLKECFNFIVSSRAAAWYYSKDSKQFSFFQSYFSIIKVLFLNHLGTTIGGALINGFFYFLDFTFDVIGNDYQKSDSKTRPPIDLIREPQQAKTVNGFLDLVRADSYAYTYLTSLPYCNSARYCQYLIDDSQFYNYSQTANRIFKINQHIVPIFLTMLIALFSMKSETSASSYGLMFIFVVAFSTITYFLAYHGDTAEGALISTYVDEALNDEHLCQQCPTLIKKFYDLQGYKNKEQIISFKQILLQPFTSQEQTH